MCKRCERNHTGPCGIPPRSTKKVSSLKSEFAVNKMRHNPHQSPSLIQELALESARTRLRTATEAIKGASEAAPGYEMLFQNLESALDRVFVLQWAEGP